VLGKCDKFSLLAKMRDLNNSLSENHTVASKVGEKCRLQEVAASFDYGIYLA